MANRKPYNLETTLIVYNFIQVIVSIYIFVEVSHIKKKMFNHFEMTNDLLFF